MHVLATCRSLRPLAYFLKESENPVKRPRLTAVQNSAEVWYKINFPDNLHSSLFSVGNAMAFCTIESLSMEGSNFQFREKLCVVDVISIHYYNIVCQSEEEDIEIRFSGFSLMQTD